MARELAFVDTTIEDIDTLLVGVRPDVEAIILSPTEPALPQIADAVEARWGINAIHVIAHGRPGEVSFASGSLSASTIGRDMASLARIGSAMASNGSLQLWSCETGAGEAGESFANRLSEALGLAVSASSGLVGAADKGGSWHLDRKALPTCRSPLTGEGMAAYPGVMANNNATSGTDTITQTTGTDTLTFTNTNQVNSADFFDGNIGNDSIVISGTLAMNFTTLGVAANTGFHNYEALSFSANANSATFNANQFGAGLISTSLAVTGNTNTQGIVINNASNFTAAGWTFATWTTGTDTISINGTSGADTITGSSESDTITGAAGADTLNGGGGNDTFSLASGDFAAGESIDGGTGTDAIVLTASQTTNFSAGTLVNVETLTGSTGADAITLNAAQFGGLTSIDLSSDSGGSDSLTILVSGNVDISAANTPTTSNIESSLVSGSAGNDALTVTGTQLDRMLIGSSSTAVVINLGNGTDTLNLKSTSADLNTIATNNASIVGVEVISAASATSAVTLTLTAQTEAFTLTGSGFGDTFTGGSGADVIDGGAGNDTITGGAGADAIQGGADNDTIDLATGDFVAGESIDGGNGTDTIAFVTTGDNTSVDFTVGTFANVETLTSINQGSSNGYDQTFGLTATQWASLSSIDMNDGTGDTLTVLAAGNISALSLPTVTDVEVGRLVGTTGADSITLTGAQLDAIIIGTGTIDLNTGTDTINLTSTSNDLNTLGLTNASIAGVEVISASTAAAGVTISLSGQTEAFTITGSAQADTITGGTGADIIDTGAGDDTINIAAGQFVAGESIQGGADSGSGNRDTIVLTTSGTTADFSVGTISGVETITGSGGNDTVTLTATQWANLTKIDLAAGTDTVNVNVSGTANISALGLPTVTNVETGNLTGTTNADTITLTGAQLDAILQGTGTVNLGNSSDTINLTSTSSRLNTLGATDASISNTEIISASTAAAGVTITLTGQTEALTVTGSAQNDTISGGAGADTITGNTGADTLDGGAGDDTFNLASGDFIAGESIQGGANGASGVRDRIVLTTAGTTVDFSTGTVAGVETMTGSTGNDTVRLNATQLAGFLAVDLVGGTDVLNVVATGNISALALPTISNVETGNLVGTAGTDSVTLSGAQLDAIIIGAGTIDLDGGAGDTINLTSTSTDLNQLGLADASISGVEAVSAASAAAGVTITLSGQTEGFTLTGSAQADTITGGGGSDDITGGAGADILGGGGSDDIFHGFLGADSISGGLGVDTLSLTATSTDLNAASDAQLATVEVVSLDQALSGVTLNLANQTEGFTISNNNAVADTITGSSGADLILGMSAGDSINGGGGADDLRVGTSASALNAASNAQIANVETISSGVVGSGVSYNLSNQTEGFAINTYLFGDTIIGSAGNDTISSSDGNDTVTGGGGNDAIDGGAGTGDTAVFSGARSDYTISLSGGIYTVVDNRGAGQDGTDTVTNVENFQFSNGTLAAGALDTTAPTITTVAFGTHDGVLIAGESIDLIVTFSETVTVTGTPTLTLNNGAVVTLSSGSGTNTLTFTYTAALGQDIADILISSYNLTAGGASVRDIQGNAATTIGAPLDPGGPADIEAVDTIATASITLDVVTADNIINAAEAGSATIAITGTVGGDVKDGDAITLTVNGVGYTHVVSGTTFSINVAGSDLAAVTSVSASVTATDTAGNTATASTTRSYTVDTTADAGNDLSVTLGDTLIANGEKTAVAYTVNGLDPGAVATVTFTDGTTTVTGVGGLANLSTLTDGPITVSVSATDAAGNTTPGTGATITLDTTADAGGNLAVLFTDTLINNTEKTAVAFSLAGLDSGATATVTFSNGVTSLVVSYGATEIAAGSATVNLSGFADGPISVSVSATDVAGNTTPGAVTSITLDTTADADGSLAVIVPDVLVNNTEKVAVSYSVAGLEANATATVTFTDGDGNTVVVSYGPVEAGAGSATADLSTLVDGPVFVAVSAMDAAGNIADGVSAVTFLDTVAEAFIALDPITDDNIINSAEAGGTLTVTGTVGGEVKDGDIVTLTINDVIYTGQVSNGGFSIPVAGANLAADADLTVEASVTTTDDAGNVATASTTFGYEVDTTADAFIQLGPITDDNVLSAAEAGETITITGSVGGDVVDGDTVTVVVNGQIFQGAVSDGSFSIDVPGADLLADPDLTVEASVTATDANGNVTQGQSSQTYEIDGTATASISLDSITADNIVNAAEANDVVTVSGTVDGDVKDGDTVTLLVKGDIYTGLAAAGAFSIDVPGSALALDPDLTVDAAVTATDAAGNSVTVSTTRTYTVDTAAEATITLDPVTADNILSAAEAGATVAITGTVGGDVKDGDTVTLLVKGDIYTGLAAAGAFSIDVPGSALALDPDLTVDAAVTATDAAGNSVTVSATRTYTVDTAAEATITLDPVTADNILNAAEAGATVAITGTVGGDVKDGDTVTLLVKGDIYTGLAAAGAFSIDVPGSALALDPDLTVDAAVTATDAAGNSVTVSATRTYTVDTAAEATITLDPVTADNILSAAEAGATVAITGTVGGDVKDGDTVTLLVKGDIYTGLAAAGAFSIDVPGSALALDPDLTVDAAVTATDAAGNSVTVSATRTYTVDTAAEATITLDPVTADNILSAAEAGATVAITGTVGGDVKDGDTVTLLVKGDIYTGLAAAGAFSIDVPGSALALDPDLTVDAAVTATDAAGNSVTVSTTRTYTVDTAAEATITLDPVTADNILSAAEAGATVAITGTVGGDVKDGDTVTLLVKGDIYTGLAAAGAFSIDVPGSALALDPDLTVDAAVTATDAAGNSVTVSTTRTYTVDTAAEATITLDPVTADNILSAAEAGATVAITGTVGGDVKDGDTVTLLVKGDIYTGLAAAGAFSIDVPGSALALDPDLTVDAAVTATDAAGNSVTVSTTRTYTVDTAAEATITLDPVTADNILSAAEAGATVAITGTVGGDVKDGDTVTLLVKGDIYTGLAAAGAFSIDVPGSALALDPDLTVDAAVTATDAAGNSVTVSATRTYTVDTAAEATITLDPVTADNILSAAEAGATVAITGTVGGDVKDGDTVTLLVKGDIYTGLAAAGAFSIDVPGSALALDPDLTVDAAVTATDAAGNSVTVSTTRTYTVDTAAEATITLDPVTADNILSAAEAGATVAITGTVGGDVKDGDTVTLLVKGDIYTGLAAAGAFSIDVPGSALALDPDLTVDAAVTATDAAGNSVTVSATRTYTVDTAAEATITLDPVTADNILSAAEAGATVAITGTVGGDVKDGDTVTLLVKGDIYTGLAAAGAFSIDVPGSALALDPDLTVDAAVTATDAAGNSVTVSTTRTYTVDTAAEATITLDPVTADNILSAAEAGATVAITGTVGGDVKDGDTVTLLVKGDIYTGLAAAGAFSIDVPGSALALDPDLTVDAAVTATDAAGNSVTVSATRTYTVDTAAEATITLDPVTADNILSAAEAGATVAITGTVGGDVKDGDTVTLLVKGDIYTGLAAAGAFSIDVPGSALALDPDLTVDAAVTATDAAGNSVTVSATRTYTVDTAAEATITLDPVTADNILSAAEAGATVAITGTVGGDVKDGDTVTLLVKGDIYTGLAAAGAFSIDVPGSALALDPDLTVDAAVTATDAAGNSVTVSATRTYTVDTAAEATITLDPVTADNILSAAEAGATVAITGTVGGDVKDGDTVTLLVKGDIYTGLAAAGAFSIDVPGSALALDPDLTVDAAVTATDAAGNSVTVSATRTYTVDTAAEATITLDPVTADNILSAAEAGATVAITGTVGGDVKDGDTVTLLVKGDIYTGLAAAGAFSIDVPGSALALDPDLTVDAAVTATDAAGNSVTVSTTRTYTVELGQPPVITSNGGGATAAISIPENSMAVTTVSATDADSAGALIYSIIGGVDASKFTINASTGALAFIFAADFELPADSNGDNVYDVTVRVSDGSLTDSQTIAVTVTNVSGLVVGDGNDNTLIGTSEDDTINGLGGNDLLRGGLGKDSLDGGTGTSDTADYSDKTVGVVATLLGNTVSTVMVGGLAEDTIVHVENLTGGSAADTLTGDVQANNLNGGAGADLMRGIGGSDTYVVDNANDIVDESIAGSSGLDVVKSSTISIDFTNTAQFVGAIERIVLEGSLALNATGNALDNLITGNSGQNTLDGRGGGDVMRGLGNDDTYVIDNVNDIVNESVAGSSGLDVVKSSTISIDLNNTAQFVGAIERIVLEGSLALNATGNALDNLITGNSGQNTLDGRGGGDVMRGLGNDDTYVIDNVNDIVNESVAGSNGLDVVKSSTISIDLTNTAQFVGAIERITLESTGALNATGNALDNLITGNSGANTIDGRGGGDVMRGLGGNDTYVIDNVSDIVNEAVAGSNGLDVVKSSAISIDFNNTVQFAGVLERIVLEGSLALNATGNALDNLITGNSGANTIDGRGGGDVMRGLGNDDTYVIDNVNDIVNESVAGSNGLDVVKSSTISIDFTNTAQFVGAVERIILESTGAINATGNALDNLITGNSGANTIDGKGGGDVMRGLGGNDTYVIDNVSDIVNEAVAGSNGLDVVKSSAISIDFNNTVQFAGVLERIVLEGSLALNATGNALDNLITGNSGANTIDGRGGGDVMRGVGGSDIYVVDNVNDMVSESLAGSNGIDVVKSSVISIDLADTAHFAGAIERITLEGSLAINARGNALDNLITGNGGANVIEGRGGGDVLRGLGGSDSFVFSLAADSGLGALRDTINDFEDVGDNDTLDLSGFAGTLTYIGQAAFTAADQVRATTFGNHVLVEINTIGTTGAESEILLAGTTIGQIDVGDFIV